MITWCHDDAWPMTASPPLDITLVSAVCKCDCARGDVAVSYAGQERRRERNDLLTDQIVRARDTQGDYLHVDLTPSPRSPQQEVQPRDARACVMIPAKCTVAFSLTKCIHAATRGPFFLMSAELSPLAQPAVQSSLLPS